MHIYSSSQGWCEQNVDYPFLLPSFDMLKSTYSFLWSGQDSNTWPYRLKSMLWPMPQDSSYFIGSCHTFTLFFNHSSYHGSPHHDIVRTLKAPNQRVFTQFRIYNLQTILVLVPYVTFDSKDNNKIHLSLLSLTLPFTHIHTFIFNCTRTTT